MAPPAPPQLCAAIKAIHYTYPGLVLCYFVLALMVTVCTLQTQRLRVKDQHVRRDVLLGLMSGVALSYVAELIVLVIQTVVNEGFPTDDRTVYLIASAICFGSQCLALTDSKFPVWYPYYVTWFMGLLVELVLLVVPNVYGPPENPFDFTSIVLQSIRVCFFAILPALYFGLRNDNKEYDNADAERQSLLRKKLSGKPASEDSTKSYGGTTDTNNQDSENSEEASDAGSEDSWLARQREAEDKIQKRLQQDGNWFTYAKGFAIFFPYLWPVHDKSLQFRAVLVGFCLLASNAFNVLVPIQMGIMIDRLTDYMNPVDPLKPKPNVWIPVAIYAVLRFVNGGSGVGWLKKWLWLPVEQYSYDALSTASHAHLMSLSSDFHDNKTSSDLTQAVHGGRSVTDLLETVCFQVLPMFIDLAVAFAILWALYGPYMGLLMAATAVTYLYVTTKLYSRRAAKRRDYITIYRKEWTIGQQSLDGWSTASLFNMIPYERHRYACAVKEHMNAKKGYEMSSQAIGAAQGLILSIGLLGALWLGVFQVLYRDDSVGKFATLLVYWAQLQGPLTFFATMYRQISYSLMDAERLLELFQTKPTVTDIPNAKSLKLCKGLVKFDRVSFAYDERKPTLQNVSFEVPAGKTVALVGETGGGKSTILKLIDRFYDVKSGSISIDGQDVRDVTLDSLREKIGVVPQDPMLFNDSIMNNIRYARITASDKEVYEACKAAAVHEKIMSFPDGYNSKVGDRGVKLSGGEKQRVAIARAILKQPEIILLDEATSAVDTETEQLIQEGFRTLCKDRTTFIVAHRLSTIMKADHILVVMNGEIIEKGTHDELLHTSGKYHDLWSKQIFVKPTPSSNRSRSSSPKKRDATLVNDLTPQRHTKELAKVLKTVQHDDESGQENSAKKDGEKSEGSNHKRESSKLKPDAPEFVPSFANSTATDSPSKLNPKEAANEAAKAQKKQDKDEKKSANLAKKAEKIEKKISKLGTDALSSTGGNSSAGPSNDQLTEGDLSTNDKSKPKRSRYKRQLSRSDPSSRGIDQTDGQQDSDVTAVSSGEGQPFQGSAMHRRRVSAPINPGSNSDTRGPRRRSRHWRLRNRTAENGMSGSTSTGASGEASADDIRGPAPPVSSPAVNALQKTPRVTFAPSHVDSTSSIVEMP